jgi:hypothetical protein
MAPFIRTHVFSLANLVAIRLYQQRRGIRIAGKHHRSNPPLRPFTTKDSAMIEFRWIVVLTLWTLLIGPILDFTQSTPTVQATRAKTKNIR